ncbi:hypothetical protein OE88DRAFT_1667712 [Heliocybe sulcata]|uniref:HNH nuclease domain-containing protein n=1 Tax=Heliocybe sulcata TaxID=5364 RepID=A0A5C3MY23_9AGAM|nr:hypothetical protein OE88DRAFT_1667712 [Heliocybe sulcata]
MNVNPELVSLRLGREANAVSLDIPIDIVTRLCVRPMKYLKYLGWSILDIPGELHSVSEGLVVEDSAQLIPGATYIYDVDNLANAKPVNFKVANKRTESRTQTSQRDNFRETLSERDRGCCIFTAVSPTAGTRAVHIIPFARGEKWLQEILMHRSYSRMEDVPLEDVHLNHSVNGFMASPIVHHLIGSRRAAVLQVPNCMLSEDDVRQELHPNWKKVRYTHGVGVKHYIFQWLDFNGQDADVETATILPNCILAAFPGDPREPQPSPLLLHYIYGCTVLRLWGRNTELLANSPNFVHSPPPTPRMVGPPQSGVGHGKAIASGSSGEKQDDAQWYMMESGAVLKARRFRNFDSVMDLVCELSLRSKPEVRRAIEAEKQEWESRMQSWVEGVDSNEPPEDPQ